MALGARQRLLLRIGVPIAVFTLLLTASFIGFLAAISGQLGDVEARAPWYLIGAALTFVGTIVLLEVNDVSGRTIIVTAVVVAVAAFGLLALGVEGFIFAVHNPGAESLPRLVLYFFSAALVATGLGYWGLKHWREFTGGAGQSL